MWQCLILGFLICIILAVYSVNKFSNLLHSPPGLSLILILGLYIPFSIIFLLPIDLVSSSQFDEDKNNFFYVESKRLIFNLWRFNYWLGFIMTWLLLPVIQCYYSSNNFTFQKRLRDSLVYNLKFYLIYLLIGLVGLVYVYFNIGLTWASIKALVIVLSHSYSLILAIWFMGYGLINIPKSLFWDSLLVRLNDNYMIDHYYLRLLSAKQDWQDNKVKFRQIVGLINNLICIVEYQHNDNHKLWIHELYLSIPAQLNNEEGATESLTNNLKNYNNRFNQELVIVNNQLSDEFLTRVTKTYKDSYYSMVISENVYYNLLRKVIKVQDIKLSKNTHAIDFRVPNKVHLKYSIYNLINSVVFKSARSKYLYYYHLNPLALKVFGGLAAVLSAIIILSEIFHNSTLSLINYIITHIISNYNLLATLLITVLLSYMCITSLISLSKTKIFLVYKLISNNSNPSSCVWYTSYAIRLTIPLTYNFLTLLNKQILSSSPKTDSTSKFQKSQFAIFLGNSINFINFGKTVNNVLPYFIVVPILIQVLGKKRKTSIINNIKQKFYLDDFDFFMWEELEGEEQEDNDERRQTLIVNQVTKLIETEFNSRNSLLNTYDDNYSLFYNNSLKYYIDKYWKHSGNIHIGEPEEENWTI